MKYLQANPKPKAPENKMMPGSRPDQKDEFRSNPDPKPVNELRQLADRYGVKYDQLVGTGPDGSVTKDDIKKARKDMDDAAKKAAIEAAAAVRSPGLDV